MEGSQRDRPRCAAAEPCACLAAMEGAATVDYSRAEVAKGKDALIEWRTQWLGLHPDVGSTRRPTGPEAWIRLGSARIGGAIGRMTLALTLALCKTRMYPLCTHREVLVWVTGVVAGAF